MPVNRLASAFPTAVPAAPPAFEWPDRRIPRAHIERCGLVCFVHYTEDEWRDAKDTIPAGSLVKNLGPGRGWLAVVVDHD